MTFSFKRLLKWVFIFAIIASLILTGFTGKIFSSKLEKDKIAKVGSQYITTEEFLREYKNQAYDIGRNFNFTLSQEQLKGLGIGKMVLDYLVQQKIAKEILKRVGFEIGEKSAIDIISKEEYFFEDNLFNRSKFDSFLEEVGITEKQYIKEVASIFGLGIFYRLFSDSGVEYKKIVQDLYRYDYQSRKAGIAYASTKDLLDDIKTEEDQLLDFYKKNKKIFYTQEQRSGAVFKISLETAKQDLIAVEERDVEKGFHEIGYDKLFDIEYIKFDSVEEAGKSKDLIDKEIELYKEKIRSLKDLTAFDYQIWNHNEEEWEKDEWNLVFRDGKFYLARLTAVKDLKDESLKLDLMQKIKHSMRLQRLLNLIQKIEEETADSIVSLEHLVSRYGGEYKDFDFTTRNQGQDGKLNSKLSENDLNAAFETRENKFSGFFIDNHEDYSLGKSVEYKSVFVAHVKLPIEQNFDSVKDLVEAKLKEKIRDDNLEVLANDNAENGNFYKEAIFYRTDLINKEKDQSYEKMPNGLLTNLFEININEKTKAFRYKDGFIVASLLDIKNPDPDILISAAIELKLKNQFTQSLAAELIQRYGKELKIRFNTELIKEMI